jgi:hypothetical protein
MDHRLMQWPVQFGEFPEAVLVELVQTMRESAAVATTGMTWEIVTARLAVVAALESKRMLAVSALARTEKKKRMSVVRMGSLSRKGLQQTEAAVRIERVDSFDLVAVAQKVMGHFAPENQN